MDVQPTLDVVMVIGTSGLGKSTMIKSFCKSEAITTSSSVRSCTKIPKLFEEYGDEKKDKPKRIWLDTMGAEDDTKTTKDEDILSGVMQMLIKSIPNDVQLRIKVLWIVSRQIKQTPALQTQAQFIKQFDVTSPANTWKSTIIILNKGQFSPSGSVDIQGALAASHAYGAPWNGLIDSDQNKLGDVQSIGFTRVDCLTEDHIDLELYRNINIPPDTKRKRGLLTEQEMVDEVNYLLAKIQYLPVTVHKQKCAKCGVEGDRRWVPLLCHGTPNKIHLKSNELLHPKGIIHVHQLVGTEPFHNGYITKYHSGYTRSVSLGGKYHGGSYKAGSSSTNTYGKFCPNCDNDIEYNKRIVTAGSFECNRCKARIGAHGVTYYCSVCEPNNFGYTRTECTGTWKSCHYCSTCVRSKTQNVSSSGSWSCCGRSSSTATGCRQDSETRYTCCEKSSGSVGCCLKWSCCGLDGDRFDNGCKSRHICCKKIAGSQGCLPVYECCKRGENEIGCSYACCRKTVASAPCFTECSNCHREYGTYPGCLQENVAHQMD